MLLPLITLFTGRKPNGLPSGLPKFGANLCKANLSGFTLRNESLPGADFNEANLRRVDLSGSDLQQAYFNGADLDGANLSQTNLSRANFRNADLSNVKLDGANLKHAVYDERTRLPFSVEEAEKRGMKLDNERTALP